MNYSDAFGIEFRQTEQITHDGKPARSVIGQRIYTTGPGDLWDALTNPERLPRWFLPVSGDLHEGGRYQLEGFASGTITRCDPPLALDATWESGGNTSWISVRLEPKGNGTQLSLKHVMLKDEQGEEHWSTYGPGATGVGWELSFHGLDLHLTNQGATVDQKEYETWTTTVEGKAFVRRSAHAWAKAHVASGAQEDSANRAATATAKFYTGE